MNISKEMNINFRNFNIIDKIPFFYGWVIVFVGGVILFCSAPGQTYVNSVFLEPMLKELGWSRTIYSATYTMGSLTAAVMMIIVGRVLDKFGYRLVLSILCVLLGLSTLWMSNVDSIYKLFIAFALLRTIGQGSFQLVSTNLVSTWFIKRRGFATGISSLGQGASMFVFPLLAHLLIQNFGWRSSWQILGLLVLVILLPLAIFFVKDSPEKVGLLPDGVKKEETDDSEEIANEINFTFAEAIVTKTFWFLVFSVIATPLIITGLHFHHVSILATKGLSAGLAAFTMSLFGPTALISNFFCGYLADKIPNRYLMACGQIALIFTMLWLVTITETWQAIIYVSMASISMSLVHTSYTVIWANYYGRKYLGSIRGFSSSATVGFSALGALPFGIIYDRTQSYDQALYYLILIPIFCCFCSLMATKPSKRLATEK